MADAVWVVRNGHPLTGVSIRRRTNGSDEVVAQQFAEGMWKNLGQWDTVSADVDKEAKRLWPAPLHVHEKAKLGTGEYHPLIWRPGAPPVPQTRHFKMFLTSASAALLLFRKLAAVFTVLEPVPAHENAYGHEVRELLIAACTEFEAACSSVLRANGYGGARWNTGDYVKLLGPMHLAEYTVRLPLHPGWNDMTPFARWDPATPTQSLPWYDAYNRTKHDREQHFHEGTLRHAVSAMAAVFIMMAGRFGPHSFGSTAGLGYDHRDQPVECLDFLLTGQPTRNAVDRLYLPQNSALEPWTEVPLVL